MSKREDREAWDDLSSFSPEFVFHIALGLEPPEKVCTRYNVDAETYERLRQRKDFQMAVSSQTTVIQREGVSTRLKAILMRDRMLMVLAGLAEDADTPAGTRRECAIEVLALSGMQRSKPIPETVVPEADAGQPQGGFMLHIDLSAADRDERIKIAGGNPAILAALNGEVVEDVT